MDSAVTSPHYSSDGSDDDQSSSQALVEPFGPSNPRPDLPPGVAASILRSAVASGLAQFGFEAAEEDAMDEFEGALHSLFGSLLVYAHQLAELGRRHQPTFADVLQGCRDLGVGDASDLIDAYHEGVFSDDVHIKFQRPRPPPPEPPLLHSDPEDSPAEDDPTLISPPATPPPSSDDEEGEFEEVVPTGADGQPLPGAKEAVEARRVKRDQKRKERDERRKERERRRRARERKKQASEPFKAEWLPGLPPKHSWKQTPVFPESAAPPALPPPLSQTQQAPSAIALQHLSTLRARLNDSQLVASSLRNLIRRTSARPSALLASQHPQQLANGTNLDVIAATSAAAAAAAEQGADLVSYENEWYGAMTAAGTTGGGKRVKRVVHVGLGRGTGNDDGGELGDDERGDGGPAEAEWNENRVGGASKRRRWLV
ncbi:hypothetical protein JCM1841_000919 [Sporobolomyces salmonicolor]